ncbi:RPII140-upstream gene protein [Rhodnius prolixus]|uniref:RPII140-upstream gene protein n=1 Tax=Rhodnius prolixus TaxID=13249 RepID=UPI003D189722
MIFLRPTIRTGGILCGAILVSEPNMADQPPTPAEEKLTNSWDRVRKIFTVDEFGTISPELSTICQSTFFTVFVGACYGGFVQSREAYLQFIERNQASQFVDHYEAKKKLQDHVTKSFARGALRWSWRLAMFGGLYVTFVTVLTAYRGRPSVLDYTVGGMLSGSIYQMKTGLRGVVVGGTLGAIIGLFAGSLTLTVLRFTGSSMDEVHEFRYELAQKRLRNLAEAVEKRDYRKIDTSLTEHHDNVLKERQQ